MCHRHALKPVLLCTFLLLPGCGRDGPEAKVIGTWQLESADFFVAGNRKEEKGPAFLWLEFSAEGTWKTRAVDHAGNPAKTEPLTNPHLLAGGSGAWKFARSDADGVVLSVSGDSDLTHAQAWTVAFEADGRMKISGGPWDNAPIFKRVK